MACTWSRTCVKTLQCYKGILSSISRRTFLSEAYLCRDAWHHRLNAPLLQKVDVSDLAVKLYEKFEKEGKVSPVDLDIFANKLEQIDNEQIEFAQSLFQRFRNCSEAVRMQESTHHALLRALYHLGEDDRLLAILSDKINYGIFLDYYIANILLDKFLKEKKFQEAAQIAYDQMLQEDFAHPLTRALCWYACHMHWKHPPPPPELPEETPKEDEEEEDTYIKVRYIINPWYDDHFDISRDSLLLGKTLHMIGSFHPDVLGRSYQLIGLGLYEKFDRGLKLLEDLLDKNEEGSIAKEAVEEFRNMLENVETKEEPNLAEKDAGEMTMEDVTPVITGDAKSQWQQALQDLMSRLDATRILAEDIDFEQQLTENITRCAAQLEATDIEDQTTLFTQWEDKRHALVNKQIQEHLDKQKRAELARRIIQLQEKEEKLRYYEQLDKVNLHASWARTERSIEDIVQEEEYVLPPGERGRGEK